MKTTTAHQTYASSLLHDITAASADQLPRREILLDWLADFLRRTAAQGYAVAANDVENLVALDKFVRVNRIPASQRVAL